MRAGKYRDRVTIRREIRVRAANGDYDTTWSTIATGAAQVEGLGGRESLIGQALQSISIFRITMRYRAGVLARDQVVLPDGRELNIRSAEDADGQRKDLVIVADTGSVLGEGRP